MKKTLDNLKEMLEEELKKISKKGDLSPTDLEHIEKAVCIIDKIKKIEDGGYSEGMSYGRMYYDNDTTYPGFIDEASYRRGRSPMTGRYVSRDREPNYERMRGTYERGYSGHSIKDRMISCLEGMVDEAKTDYERKVVMDWIGKLEMSA